MLTILGFMSSDGSTSLHLLDPRDNVAIASSLVSANAHLVSRDGSTEFMAQDSVPEGHKIAISPIGAGEVVLKAGHVIGVAACAIDTGEHVHLHNVRSLRGVK